MSWYWKQKPTWMKTWQHIIGILVLCFRLIDWLSFEEGGEGGCLKMGVQGQEDGRILDVAGLNNLHGCHMCIVPKHNLEAGK